jgi:hypothetical protein
VADAGGIPEREKILWRRLSPGGDAPPPDVLCSTLTPFPFWVVITSIIVFLPLALIVSFFVKRQVVIVDRGGLIVRTVSFWRYTPIEDLVDVRLGEVDVRLDGKKLLVDDLVLHPEPGWHPEAEEIVAANAKP